MVRTVLYRTQKRTLHIALLIALFIIPIKISSQSVLLPGDILTVSVNADEQSFDIIPLIDIDQGTKVNFSSGQWIAKDQELRGDELSLIFEHAIEAGTAIHVDGSENYLYTLTGYLDLRRPDKRLFTYQSEDDSYRFIYGIGWGDENIWKLDDQEGSDIPKSLDPDQGTLVTLGRGNNYQYYIRNGASGTRKMLTELVSGSSNWNLSDNSFKKFGTSFRILNPPVVQFSNTVNRISEDGNTASLNVAIYEHDGSRLSVDIVYDTLQSSAGTEDIETFRRATVNFTGISGDRVYEIQIPLKDDDSYEGVEAAMFSLENLSKGNYGDFLRHSLLVLDDEIPDLKVVNMSISDNELQSVGIINNENVPVDLYNWKLGNKETGISFNESFVIEPGQLFVLSARGVKKALSEPDLIIDNEQFSSLLEKENELMIWDNWGQLVIKESKDRYPEQIVNRNESGQLSVQGSSGAEAGTQSTLESQQITAALIGFRKSGWTYFSPSEIMNIDTEENFEFYIWGEASGKFIKAEYEDRMSLAENNNVIFAYSENSNKEEILSAVSGPDEPDEIKKWILSATDENDNGYIDGNEGVNWLIHSAGDPIYTYKLIDVLDEAGIPAEPVIFQIYYGTNGEINYRTLDKNDPVASEVPFMVRLNKPMDLQVIETDHSKLISEPINTEDPEWSGFILEAELQSMKSKVTIQFSDEPAERVSAYQSIESLQFPDQLYMHAYLLQGNDRYQMITLPEDAQEEIVIPVYLSTNTEGDISLNVRGWANIPEGWEIHLKDLTNDTDHLLSRDKSMVSEYQLTDPLEENIKLDDDRNDMSVHHYNIVITPPAPIETEEETDLPQDLELYQNYPNPFNPITTITFYLPEAAQVRLSVFNIVGQPVATLIQGNLSAGEQMVEWDATDMPSGMYIYQLETGKKIMTRKMTLVK